MTAPEPEILQDQQQVTERDMGLRLAVSSEVNEAKRYLADYFGWSGNDSVEDPYSRGAVQVDYLYDVILQCVKRGCPWNQVTEVIHLAEEFMNRSVGLSLEEAVELYRELVLSYSTEVDGSILRSISTFIFDTYMHHFQLYQFVLVEPRDEFLVTADLQVEPPPNIQPLPDAQEEHIHRYEQQLKVIQTEEEARAEDISRQRESLKDSSGDGIPINLKSGETETAGREAIEQLIQEAARSQCELAEKLLLMDLEEKQESLSYYLEKTILPRPEQLGEPPRTRQPATNQPQKATAGQAKSTNKKVTK